MASRYYLLILWSAIYMENTFAQNLTSSMNLQNISALPDGCGPYVKSMYYALCDLKSAWGIVIETVAALGIFTTLVLALIFLALAPSVTRDERKGSIAINFMFLIGVLGIFSLVFAFLIAPNAAVCACRRFLFGVLFAMCFACLVAHSVRLNYLVLQNRGPGGCLVFLLAIGLFMVEAVINVEWLLITNVRHSLWSAELPGSPCNITNQDFVTALVYVMFLILASLLIPCPVLCGHYLQWKRHGKYIVATAFSSIIIWVTWITMYLYGNDKLGYKQVWDDVLLAVALLTNGWVFIFFYIIPELVEMKRAGYQYETDSLSVMKRLSESPPSIIVENRAFSMDNLEANEQAENRRTQDKPVSPYSNYSGIYPTLPLYPAEMETVSHIHLPRVSMEPWRYHL
ncbi:G-protein coupled receptor family C group 5 member C-like [Spea bombifrons]|uniref:G-protein coupled receptor family C group 5 member C-like n=1 Tax=Spea bombifrons TaxID=233779 RepID=UPI002349DB5A|nr:G-protein coupled receptor family C group 5 member C-like [Spea bombifrons]